MPCFNMSAILPRSCLKSLSRLTEKMLRVSASACVRAAGKAAICLFSLRANHMHCRSLRLWVCLCTSSHTNRDISVPRHSTTNHCSARIFLRFISAEEQVNCFVLTAHFPISKKSAVQPTSTQVSLWTGSGSQWVCDFLREKNLKKLRMRH